MKALQAKVKACFGMRSVTAITLTLLMSKALGQATPDPVVDVPEPGILSLLGIGVLALVFMRRRK
jgi:hypothetical protein